MKSPKGPRRTLFIAYLPGVPTSVCSTAGTARPSGMMFGKKIVAIIPLVILIAGMAYGSGYKVPTKPASVAVADINLDGHPDIILGHEVEGVGGLLSILTNDGKGNLTLRDTLSTGAYETSIQVGDIDGDNEPDIVLLDYDQVSQTTAFRVVYDYGKYGFDSTRLFPLGQQITIWNYVLGSLRDSSHQDITFISSLSQEMGILYNDGKGGFLPPQYFNLDFTPASLAVGDIDGDGREDIAITGNLKIKIYLNKQSGLDTLSVNTSPIGVSNINITDIDNDGNNEIVGIDGGIPGTKKRLLVYKNDGTNNFQLSYSKWINEAMDQLFIADLNNDGYKDIIYNCSLYYPNSDSEVFRTYILFNNKDGTFQDPVYYYTGICSQVSCAADLDGNGWKDIITLNYDFYNPPPDTCSIHILFNDGTGKFEENPVTGIKDKKNQPLTFELYQNYPNPFNPSTIISYQLSGVSHVTLRMFDALGREVAELVNEKQTPGKHEVIFDAGARKLGSGVYFYELIVDEKRYMKKMLVIK
ncbi:MAG TPA: T9SS type A sorting domain-containing protein [Candidatus Kryptonia bacterium]